MLETSEQAPPTHGIFTGIDSVSEYPGDFVQQAAVATLPFWLIGEKYVPGEVTRWVRRMVCNPASTGPPRLIY